MKIFKSLFVIFAMAVLVVGATGAVFSDTETVAGNTFAAGTMDLEVNGENDPVSFSFSGENLVPGEYYQAGTVTVSNVGNVTGRLSVRVENPFSGEVTLEEPEIASGDQPGLQLGSYSVADGNGELWNSMWMQLYIDGNEDGKYIGGAAPHNDCTITSNALAKSSYYSLPIGEDLMPMSTNSYCSDQYIDLAPGESVDLGVRTYFYSDSGGGPAGGWSSTMPPTNTTMSDNMTFDLVVGLEQI